MKFKFFFLLLIVSSYLPSAWAQKTSDDKQIRRVMDEQVAAWNNGELEKFMEGYWQSDSLQFIGGRGIVYGWKPTLERYRKNYPDAAARGTLRFEILKVERLGRDTAFVVGKFFLTRPQAGNASGYFTLLWRKIGGKWKIVVDHTG